MTKQQASSNIKFWLLAFVTLFLSGSITIINFNEFIMIGLLKKTEGYPFGGEGPVPWHYQTAELYAKFSLIFGILFLLTFLTSLWATFRVRKKELIITFLFTLFLIFVMIFT